MQDALAALREVKVLLVVSHNKGGRGMATEYLLDEAALPYRPSWKETRKGATVASFKKKGAVRDAKGCSLDEKGCSSQQERVKQAAPQPSGTVIKEPLEEPLDDPPLSLKEISLRKNYAESQRRVR